MDRLWTPWRYRYISRAGSAGGCIFCIKAAENKDAENYILYRGKLNFVLLNLFPYTNGHLMIAPYRHVGMLAETPGSAGGNDALTQRGRSQSALGIPTGRIQPRDEHRQERGRGRRGPHPYARAAALDRRRQLHEHHRRDTRPAGGTAGDLREALEVRVGLELRRYGCPLTQDRLSKSDTPRPAGQLKCAYLPELNRIRLWHPICEKCTLKGGYYAVLRPARPTLWPAHAQVTPGGALAVQTACSLRWRDAPGDLGSFSRPCVERSHGRSAGGHQV